MHLLAKSVGRIGPCSFSDLPGRGYARFLPALRGGSNAISTYLRTADTSFGLHYCWPGCGLDRAQRPPCSVRYSGKRWPWGFSTPIRTYAELGFRQLRVLARPRKPRRIPRRLE